MYYLDASHIFKIKKRLMASGGLNSFSGGTKMNIPKKLQNYIVDVIGKQLLLV